MADIFTEANAEAIEAAENVNVTESEENKKDSHTGLIVGIAGATIIGGYILHRVVQNRKNAADAAKLAALTKALKEQNIDVVDVDFVEVEQKKEEKPKSNGSKKKKKK